ncbi:MAG TPA: tubulin-like doman-containing protein, partial [Micromonosporaceae bacterium]
MALRIEPGAEPIPGHRLLERLGSGGFGEVWKCTTPDGTLRAIKIVHGDLAATGLAGRTAEQERSGHRRAATVRHPFLLTLERLDVFDGQIVVVMELANGSLWDTYQSFRGRGLSGIPRADLIHYLTDVAQGLDALQGCGLQHLDVKPQNLLLVGDRGKVSDFGLVRDIQSGRVGAGATPTYTAPETFSGTLSEHCDQYSLAVVYQEMLTGIRPFVAATPQQLAHQHLFGVPNLAPLPAADRAAVARALAKKPEERFTSCVEFIRALREQRTEDRGARTEQPGVPVPSILPTVVIGVGGIGGDVLRRVRQSLVDRGQPSAVRLVYVDTDPEALRGAVETASFDPTEVLPIQLQRAGHYARLKSDARMSGPIPWFDPSWLNRLSTTQTPAGCRGLGRLAFADHVRALSQKVEADLAAVTRSLAGVPRIVIVAGLAGGTGGGTALDLAYLARHLLSRFGDPNVAGWLLLPAADADDRATANAYAALAEMRYFSRPETSYRARCDDPDGSLTTRAAPYSDLVMMPLGDPAAAADGLVRELLAPTEQALTVDECRTVGQTRMVWPRRAIVRTAARRLAVSLLQRWTRPDAEDVGGPVRGWVAEQWAALELGPEPLARRLEQAAAAVIGQMPEEAFAALAGPATGPPLPLRPEAVPAVVEKLDELLARLHTALVAATDGIARERGTRLARLAVALVEQPDFRLAGAEAAVRLLTEG